MRKIYEYEWGERLVRIEEHIILQGPTAIYSLNEIKLRTITSIKNVSILIFSANTKYILNYNNVTVIINNIRRRLVLTGFYGDKKRGGRICYGSKLGQQREGH